MAPLARWAVRSTPDWFQHMQQNLVIDDDNIFLHRQERRLLERGGAWSSAYHMPARADLYVGSFRSWLERHAGEGPFGPLHLRLGGRESKGMGQEGGLELLDRYEQHTRHCSACRGALRCVEWDWE
ncbi:unnamed protein product [Discosporangium mesarthrocarpum]